MARTALRLPRRHVVLSDSEDDSDNDEFPDVTKVPTKKKQPVVALDTGSAEGSRRRLQPIRSQSEPTVKSTEGNAPLQPTTANAVRRRKLGQISDNNPLLRAWTPENNNRGNRASGADERRTQESQEEEKENQSPPLVPRRHQPRVELRTRRRTSAAAAAIPGYDEILSEMEEEVTITEDLSSGDEDETFETARSGRSDSEENDENNEEDGDSKSDDDAFSDWDDSLVEIFPQRPPAKPRLQVKEREPQASSFSSSSSSTIRNNSSAGGSSTARTKDKDGAKRPISRTNSKNSDDGLSVTAKPAGRKDLADTFSRLRL